MCDDHKLGPEIAMLAFLLNIDYDKTIEEN